jgi:hypothetical protein
MAERVKTRTEMASMTRAKVATTTRLRAAMAVVLCSDPADRVTLDDSVRMALLVVLEQLSPPERAVFVLHDVFQFSFDVVASIVGRTPAACRQIASRARRRIEMETGPARFAAGSDEQHHVAAGFIAACAGGDLGALMRLLDPDVVGEVDLGTAGPPRRPLHGNHVVSRGLLGYFGPQTGVTLVSQPVNASLGPWRFATASWPASSRSRSPTGAFTTSMPSPTPASSPSWRPAFAERPSSFRGRTWRGAQCALRAPPNRVASRKEGAMAHRR